MGSELEGSKTWGRLGDWLMNIWKGNLWLWSQDELSENKFLPQAPHFHFCRCCWISIWEKWRSPYSSSWLPLATQLCPAPGSFPPPASCFSVCFSVLRIHFDAGLLHKLFLLFRLLSHPVPRLIPQTLNLSFLREDSPDPWTKLDPLKVLKYHLPHALPPQTFNTPVITYYKSSLSFLWDSKILWGQNTVCCAYHWEFRTVWSRCSNICWLGLSNNNVLEKCQNAMLS